MGLHVRSNRLETSVDAFLYRNLVELALYVARQSGYVFSSCSSRSSCTDGSSHTATLKRTLHLI
jgi:hypothetical protein